MATNSIDFGAPVLGVAVQGGEAIVKDGMVVAEGYDKIITARTESNQNIKVDENGVVIESIFWSTVESVEVASSIETF